MSTGTASPKATGETFPQFGRWSVMIELAYLLGIALTWTSRGYGRPERIIATALLLAMIGWWRVFGRRLAFGEGYTSRYSDAYLAGVLALFAPTVLLIPDCAWVLLGLCSQPFLVRAHRPAVVWVTVINSVLPLVVLVRGGPLGQLGAQLAIAAGAVYASHTIGGNIEHIGVESAERARLIDELRASRAEIAELSREAGVTAERERLATEIHDTLAQGFTSILTLVQAARSVLGPDCPRAHAHLDLAAVTARENLAEARALVAALAPAGLDGGSLAGALRRVATRVADECGITVTVRTGDDLGQLGTGTQVVLLRAAQEALTNIGRHSRASTATVQLTRDSATVQLLVSDDGVGFNTSAPVTGFGLAGMRARVEQIGGTFDLDSGPAGTTLRAKVPA